MKIVTVVGARPQFIKAAALSRAIKHYPNIEEVIVHTGQHYDENMSAVFFDELEIAAPKHSLMVGSGSHGAQTGLMLAKIEEVLMLEQPDVLLIYGDTNSTIAGAIAAAKLHIPIAHVEAGLRSFNRKMPEEVNRIVSDVLATWLFTPTQLANQNLLNEGIAEDKIHLVGDVMYDVALYFREKAAKQSTVLQTLNLTSKQYALVTIHRAENTDDQKRLQAIVETLIELQKDLNIVMPLHPRTRGKLQAFNLWDQLTAHVRVVEPVSYLDMVQLEQAAKLIVTDSGGVQKEAFFYQVPCITLRDETEWQELIELKWNTLVPPSDSTTMLQSIVKAMECSERVNDMPYGNGNSANKILDILLQNRT